MASEKTKKSYKCHWMFNIINILLYILQWKGPGLFYWFRNHELLQQIYFSHSQRTLVRITVPRKKKPKRERAVRRGWRFWFLFREDMIIWRCQNNSRTFSSAILRVWVLMRPGFEPVTFRSADGPLSNLTNIFNRVAPVLWRRASNGIVILII